MLDQVRNGTCLMTVVYITSSASPMRKWVCTIVLGKMLCEMRNELQQQCILGIAAGC
jgi:hypothetical protein